MTQEFVNKDVDASLQSMTDNPHVLGVPVGIGGRGSAGVRDFYARQLIGHNPDDINIELLSRTEGDDRVVDEMIFSFTHDVEMPWMLPNIPPTGKKVEIPFVVITSFRDGKIDSEHLYWDQASVLVQLGLLSARGLPVTDVKQAVSLRDTNPSPN